MKIQNADSFLTLEWSAITEDTSSSTASTRPGSSAWEGESLQLGMQVRTSGPGESEDPESCEEERALFRRVLSLRERFQHVSGGQGL